MQKNRFELTETDKIVLEYKSIIEKLKEITEEIESLRQLRTYESNKELVFQQSQKIELLNKTKEDLERRLNQIKDLALQAMNNSFSEMLRKIKMQITYDENGIPTIDDQVPANFQQYINCNFDQKTFSSDDLVLVHTTNYFPENHVVATPRDSNVLYECNYDVTSIGGKEKYGFSYSHRNTVHFALNGLVSNHTMNDFSNRKFTIIEPMRDHMDDVHCIRPEDTWFKGSVQLSDKAIILVHEEEYKNLSQEIVSQYNIIKFRGYEEKVVQKVLLLLGYKPQEIGMWNWSNDSINAHILNDYIEKNYPNKLTISHSSSIEAHVERNLELRDVIISAIRNEKVVTSFGINISYKEVLVMLEYMKKYKGNYFDFEKDLIKDFGIRVKNNQFYLLDDDSITESYKSELDKEIAKQVQEAMKVHETIIPYLAKRQNILSNLIGSEVDIKNSLIVSLDIIVNMYYFHLRELSIKDFLNYCGIRRLDNDNYQILGDLETIKQFDKIEEEECKTIESILTLNKPESIKKEEEMFKAWESLFSEESFDEKKQK